MDPLSDVLSLLKPRTYAAGGFGSSGDISIGFGVHDGIKCYAVVTGECWLAVDGVPEAVRLKTGDCFLLTKGRPFRLASDLALPPVDFGAFFASPAFVGADAPQSDAGCFIVGGHFALTGSPAEVLSGVLPPIVHIRDEADKAALRWSMERMRQELRDPAPGGVLILQHLAQMMLVQALRAHLAEGVKGGVGWLFALADRKMGAAISAMHAESIVSLDLAGTRGTRGHVALDVRVEVQVHRRLIADGLSHALAHAAGRRSTDQFRRLDLGDLAVARLRVGKRLQHRVQASHGLFAETIRWTETPSRVGNNPHSKAGADGGLKAHHGVHGED